MISALVQMYIYTNSHKTEINLRIEIVDFHSLKYIPLPSNI